MNELKSLTYSKLCMDPVWNKIRFTPESGQQQSLCILKCIVTYNYRNGEKKRSYRELIQSAFLKMACNSLVWSGRKSHCQKRSVEVKALNQELARMRMREDLRHEEAVTSCFRALAWVESWKLLRKFDNPVSLAITKREPMAGPAQVLWLQSGSLWGGLENCQVKVAALPDSRLLNINDLSFIYTFQISWKLLSLTIANLKPHRERVSGAQHKWWSLVLAICQPAAQSRRTCLIPFWGPSGHLILNWTC